MERSGPPSNVRVDSASESRGAGTPHVIFTYVGSPASYRSTPFRSSRLFRSSLLRSRLGDDGAFALEQLDDGLDEFSALLRDVELSGLRFSA